MKTSIFFLASWFMFGVSIADTFDDGSRYAFVASYEEQSITIVDMHRKNISSVVKLTHPPAAIAASDRMRALVVAPPAQKRLTLIDLSSEALTRYDYPLSIIPDAIKLSPLGDTLAVYDRQQQILEVQSILQKRRLLRVGDVRTETPVTFSIDGSSVYWVDQTSGDLRSSDLWSKVSSLSLSRQGDGLSSMSRSIDGALGFVSDGLAGKVYVIDLKNFAKLSEIYVGKTPGRSWGTADGSAMLVPNKGSGTITAISTVMLDTLYTVEVLGDPVAIYPGWLDSTAIVLGQKGNVTLLDLQSGGVVERWKFDGRPGEGIVTSDSKTLALPFANPGRVAVFNFREKELEKQILGLPADIGNLSIAISNNLCH